jgi:Domain of unknown function (DUF4349)
MAATDTDFEREFAELVAQLREAPTSATDSLRARVRALGEPEAPPSLRDRLAIYRWRRAVLVVAPACVAALLSVAVVRGILSSGSSERQVTSGESGAVTTSRKNQRAPLVTPVPPALSGTATTDAQKGPTAVSPHLDAAGRPVDVDASLRVRVPDLGALSDRTTQAMQIARSLGGYVASVQQTSTVGKPGEADLLLRVPVAKVDTALIQLARLGTVLDQHLSVVDLKQTLAQQQRQIRNLRLQIARLQQALRSPSLTPDVRLRLQFQLDNARQKLSALRGTNRATLREAALSDLSLALTTPQAAGSGTSHHEGRFGRAARAAGSFLLAAGAVALFVLIAVSPLLVLAAVWLYGSRAYRRREERRLLTPAPE